MKETQRLILFWFSFYSLCLHMSFLLSFLSLHELMFYSLFILYMRSSLCISVRAFLRPSSLCVPVYLCSLLWSSLSLFSLYVFHSVLILPLNISLLPFAFVLCFCLNESVTFCPCSVSLWRTDCSCLSLFCASLWTTVCSPLFWTTVVDHYKPDYLVKGLNGIVHGQGHSKGSNFHPVLVGPVFSVLIVFVCS